MDQQQAAVMAEYDEFAFGAVSRPVERSGGFSDAAIWEVTSPAGRFALRRWPSGYPTPPRRAWLHRFLIFVRDRGLPFIAAPLKTKSGATFVELGGHSWEAAPWLPGTPDRSSAPSPQRVAAALDALAQFHRAAALFPPGPTRGPSPGLADREMLTRLLLQGDADQLRKAIEQRQVELQTPPSLVRKSHQILDLFQASAPRVAGLLAQHSQTIVPLLPCLRDVWSEHVLFEGDRVTGIIDYGALRTDSIAGDVTRLLGSLASDNLELWKIGLDAYSSRRPLQPGEQSLLQVFDESSVLLSGTHWIRWIFVDSIQFRDLSAVEQRMDHWLARLPVLARRPSDCTFLD
jgi:Ser/Thr protein kinase RdoA (MazF antagonist)